MPPQSSHVPPTWQQAFLALARGFDPVLVLDPDGSILRLSRPLGGIAPAQTIGRSLGRCVVPADAAAISTAAQQAIRGVPQAVEAAVPSGAGRRWYRFHMVPWPQEDVVLVVCTETDATRRELDRLRGVERLMRDTQGISHMGVWTWDVRKSHVEWSDSLYALYGLDPDTHIPTYEDYLARVHPDDVERVRGATAAVFQDQKPFSHDERIRHADGSWRHLHTWARAVADEHGALVALQGVCLDITERKEAELALARSEARQKAILHNAGLGIASLSPDGILDDANAEFLALLGIERVPVALAKALPQQAPELEAALQRTLAGQAGQCTVQAGSRWVRIMLSHAHGAPFAVAVAQDVSAEHAAEEAAQRVRQLEEAGRDRARRLGMASHELKNPLTPLLLQMELLRRSTSELGPREQHIIQRIGAQVQRLDRLVRDFMDTARAEEGLLGINPEPADLCRLVKGVLEAHAPAAEAAGVRLHRTGCRRAPSVVDVGRIVQVVDNLVANALRFTPSGGRIRVRIEATQAGHRISVEDNGVGIPEDAQAQLFVPYAETGVAPVRAGPTTGLGLYICQAIVLAHEGRIGIDSEPGRGTRVWFELPSAVQD